MQERRIAMESRVTLLGHPVHQMLIVFPLGLLATSVVFDVIFLANREAEMAVVAYWTQAAGIVGALLAAPFGLLDWMRIPAGTRAKRVGAMHGGGNLIVVALFLVSWLLRTEPPQAPSALALLLSFSGVALAFVTGWLGGELVVRHGMGVHRNAGLDAPSSLHDPHHEARSMRHQP
jgi:uncharacterized membrane protein